MAKKQVIWSIRVQQDRIAILKYWIERNKTKTYSKKLFALFNQAADLISDHPKIGKPTNYYKCAIQGCTGLLTIL